MDEIANRAAEIELYSDIVKIGFPAIAGLLGAFIGSIATFIIEKNRINATEIRERQEFHRQQVTNLINNLSDFSGAVFTYISLLLTKRHNYSEELENKITESGLDMLSKNTNLKKANVALCILNHSEITDFLDAYTEQVNITIDILLHPSNPNPELPIKDLKTREKELFKSLTALFSEIK